jgi:nickel superoxide dismutase
MFNKNKTKHTPKRAYAHCDIPCGIYSPHPSAIAAETVERMVQLITLLELPKEGALNEEWMEYHNTFTRLVKIKEEHAELCKREIQILWTDFFQETHLAEVPDLHTKIWKATKLCSRNKQHVDPEAAKELRIAVEEIGEIFLHVKASK